MSDSSPPPSDSPTTTTDSSPDYSPTDDSSSDDSSPAEPDPVTKKQKLDETVNPAVPRRRRHDAFRVHLERLKPEFYQQYVDMCNLALAEYKKHPGGKCYAFVNLKKLRSVAAGSYIHTLTFKAKNEDGTIARFRATVCNRTGGRKDKVRDVKLLG